MKTFPKKFVSMIIILIMLLSVFPVQTFASTISGIEVVDYAMKYEGYPYVHAGKGPDNFDCSGFVYYVFKHFGISFPAGTDAYNTENEAKAYGTVFYDMSQAKAGDLVIWDGHIAIYTENGKCINALNKKYGVCVIDVEAFNNGVLNPPHFFLRPSFYENEQQENEYYQVTFEKYNATLTYDNGMFTASMIDTDLKQSYPVNQSQFKAGDVEHEWNIIFTDGKNYFKPAVYFYKNNNIEGQNSATILDMYIALFRLVDGEWNGRSTWHGIGNIVLTVEGTELSWRFDIPDEYDFDIEKMQILNAEIMHKEKTKEKDFFETIRSAIETIFKYFLMPFDFLKKLFAI